MNQKCHQIKLWRLVIETVYRGDGGGERQEGGRGEEGLAHFLP